MTLSQNDAPLDEGSPEESDSPPPTSEEPTPQAEPIPAESEPPSTGPGQSSAKEQAEGSIDEAATELAPPTPSRPKKKKKKADTAGRGIETMFRTAYRTHLDLSNLADTKANIMISINGIIISIIFASVSDTVAENPSLLFPAAVILLTCLGSLVFAILAARPRVSSEVVDSEQVRSGKRNILFFGNFVNMPEAEFVEGIQDLMGRRDDLYGTMSRDLYSLGGVLQKKYRLIRTAYNIFMVGISLGVTMFVIVLAIGVMVPPSPFTP